MEPQVPVDASVDDYLAAIRYRRYSSSVLYERRRFLLLAAGGGPDAWIMDADVEEVVASVLARSNVRSKVNLRKLRSAVLDYRRWRREREGRP